MRALTATPTRKGRHTLRRALVVGALAAGLAGALAPTALAARADLAFRDERAISLTWEQATAGRPVVVCNVSERSISGVALDASGFGFKRERASLPDVDVISLDGAPADGTLDAGRCTTVTLRAAEVAVDAGSYEGRLVATGRGGGIARLAVTVALARDEQPAEAVLEAPADPIVLAATRDLPIDGEVTLNGKLALGVARRGTLATLTEGRTIGNVFGHGEVGVLRVTGPADMDSKPGAVVVPVRLEGISKIGDFTGTIRPTADDRVSFRVKVTSTDAWPWAVLAIVFGAALGLLPQLWPRRLRPKWGLRDELAALPGAYRVAFSYWCEHRRDHPEWPDVRISEAKLARFTADTRTAIRTYASGTLFFDTASEEFRTLRKPLADAAADAACLRGESGLAGALLGLEHASSAVADYLREAFPAKRPPRLLVKARGPFEPAPPETIELGVGEATARAAAARELTALLDRWLALAREVLRYELWALLLSRLAELPQDAGGLDERDRTRLRKAHARVVEAHEELLDVDDAAGLERVGAEQDLREAYAMLARLGGRHRVWVGPELADPRPADLVLRAVSERNDLDVAQVRDLVRRWAARSPAASFAEAPSGIFGVAEFVLEPLRTLRVLAGSRRLWDTIVVALAVLVGIVAGLEAFYFGKTFGTWQDYLAVILVGTGSQLLLKGLTDALASVWAPALPRVVDAGRAASGSVVLRSA